MDNDIQSQTEELRANNARVITALSDAGYTFDPIDILLLRTDMISQIMIDLGLISREALDHQWEIFMAGLLQSSIADIERRSEIVTKEAHE